MWVSKAEWKRLQEHLRDMDNRLDGVEWGVGLGICDDGRLYACTTRFGSDFKINQIVEALFERSGMKAHPKRGPIVE